MKKITSMSCLVFLLSTYSATASEFYGIDIPHPPSKALDPLPERAFFAGVKEMSYQSQNDRQETQYTYLYRLDGRIEQIKGNVINKDNAKNKRMIEAHFFYDENEPSQLIQDSLKISNDKTQEILSQRERSYVYDHKQLASIATTLTRNAKTEQATTMLSYDKQGRLVSSQSRSQHTIFDYERQQIRFERGSLVEELTFATPLSDWIRSVPTDLLHQGRCLDFAARALVSANCEDFERKMVCVAKPKEMNCRGQARRGRWTYQLSQTFRGHWGHEWLLFSETRIYDQPTGGRQSYHFKTILDTLQRWSSSQSFVTLTSGKATKTVDFMVDHQYDSNRVEGLWYSDFGIDGELGTKSRTWLRYWR